MAESRSQIQCQTPECRGWLGADVAGDFIPAGHLVGGRDWWMDAEGGVNIRCRRCNRWYRAAPRGGRVQVDALPAA